MASQAAPVYVMQNGLLAGIDGVAVNGVNYQVRFKDGTCAALFSGCDQQSDFVFQDFASVAAAGQALQDLLVDSALGSFDSIPNQVFGCTNGFWGQCGIDTPWDVDAAGGTYMSRRVENWQNEAQDWNFFVIGLNPAFDTSGGPSVFAVWTPLNPIQCNPRETSCPPSQVPEPGSAALVLAALAGAVTAGRRARRRPRSGGRSA